MSVASQVVNPTTVRATAPFQKAAGYIPGGMFNNVATGTAVAGMSVVEYGSGPIKTTVITLTACAMAFSDTTVGGSLLIYNFPEGHINILDATGTPVWTTTSTLSSTINASKTGNWGIGSVAQSSTTLATTEIDILPGVGATPIAFVSSATINVAGTATAGALSAVGIGRLDGTTTASKAYLNAAFATNTDIDGDATTTVTGVITIVWFNGGDY